MNDQRQRPKALLSPKARQEFRSVGLGQTLRPVRLLEVEKLQITAFKQLAQLISLLDTV
jgi:hypothetical protein